MLGRKKAWAAAALAAATLVPTAATAHQPESERRDFDLVEADEFLSAECGVEVINAVKGHIITRTHSGHGTGVSEIKTINIGITSTAGDNSFRFRDVGADLLRTEPDGTMVISIVGQVPFFFNGVLKLDPDTGEVIHEPQKLTGEDLAEACAALTA